MIGEHDHLEDLGWVTGGHAAMTVGVLVSADRAGIRIAERLSLGPFALWVGWRPILTIKGVSH